MLYIWLHHNAPWASQVAQWYAGDAGDAGSILGLGRSPGEGNGNPRQYSCLENSMDRGAWQATAADNNCLP